MSITHGTVQYTTPRPYESASAQCALSFTVDVGEDAEAVAAQVGAMARRRAIGMVAMTEEVKVSTKAYADPLQPATSAAPPPPAMTAVLDIMGAGAAAGNPTATAAPPAAATEPSAPPAPATTTDAQLLEAVTARNAALITAAGQDDLKRQMVPPAIHKLIGDFVDVPPGPGRLSKMIPARREGFLKALAELTV
jgi:hypothetical protein